MDTLLHSPGTCTFLSSSQSRRPFRRRKSSIAFSATTDETLLAKSHLLSLISDQERGVKTETDPLKRSQIIKAIDALAVLGKDMVTTDSLLSATWRLLWTTEKEQLFIIKNAKFFGTETGDVLQVIDVERRLLNNVITFPPDGVFFVRSTIDIASRQRVNFRFTSAVLRGKNWEFPLPPYGQGWGTSGEYHLLCSSFRSEQTLFCSWSCSKPNWI
ncbi:probable plastid-lipid-associated protein 11, chloroplastic isoform X2 [Aristolochia californica]|uniref:probable plastid-lipid-associated protein 11, chloroplastic isoform X2 n=1 Tax=Aristolochia californica TaxID=171875 RepID=UPI0035DC8199